jgi:acetate kinase
VAVARVLVVNAGSSSLKASLIEVGRREPLAATAVEWGSDATRFADRHATLAATFDRLQAESGGTIDGVGHRVVHGGERFREPTVVDDDILAELDELSQLAPLHNPVAVETIRAAREVLPDVPHVAAFDTAFHASLEPAAFIYPLPWQWRERWGVRRFGFHGLSVEWSVRRAAELLGRPLAELGLVVAHLGSGCSATAVAGGRSVATSMGLTPLEGLMMGTRAGSIDPGIVLRLLRENRLGLDELADVLDHGSGLLGVSGASGDLREVDAAAGRGDERAALAIEMFVRRGAEGIAAIASALDRLDAVVFTGGIGENAADVRARMVGRLAVLGVPRISSAAVSDDAVLSAPGASPAVLRIEAREDLIIAGSAAQLLGTSEGHRSAAT